MIALAAVKKVVAATKENYFLQCAGRCIVALSLIVEDYTQPRGRSSCKEKRAVDATCEEKMRQVRYEQRSRGGSVR